VVENNEKKKKKNIVIFITNFLYRSLDQH